MIVREMNRWTGQVNKLHFANRAELAAYPAQKAGAGAVATVDGVGGGDFRLISFSEDLYIEGSREEAFMVRANRSGFWYWFANDNQELWTTLIYYLHLGGE